MKKKDRLLITGAAGFIGSRLAESLKKNYEIIAVDDLSKGKLSNLPKDIKFFQIDLSKKNNLKKIPKCDYIFHLAGQSSGDRSFDDPIIDLEKNTITTLNLINYGVKNLCKKLVYASSMSVYGNLKKKKVTENSYLNPISCYGVGKLASEQYLKIYQKKLKYIIFRMFNVYGPGQDLEDQNQGMVSIYLSQFLKKKKFKIKGSLKRSRDFIFIDDVIEIWKKSLDPNITNQTFNLGTGKATNIKTLLGIISNKTKIKKLPSTRGDQFNICSNNKKLNFFFKKKKYEKLKNGIKKFINYELYKRK